MKKSRPNTAMIDPAESIDELIARSYPALAASPLPDTDTPTATTVASQHRRLRHIRAKIADLETEALRHFRPLPHVEAFHRSRKPINLLVGSNQSAKTVHADVEIARAVSGQDPYDKYPKENGRCVLVGFDADHLNDPLFKKLFVQGEFQLVLDEHTRKPRAVRPDPNDPTQLDPYDKAYKEKWFDAPPLIPERLVAEQSMEHAGKGIPRLTRMKNGWQILWRSSNSRPPRGRQIHIVLLDEDLQKAGAWINEIVPRLLKQNGKLIWAATGQEGGVELTELIERANEGSPYIDVFHLLISQNPFISDEQREFLRTNLTSDEEVAVRYFGELATVARLIYREYSPNGVHGCEPFDIPRDWSRYILLDPSRQRCGTLFLAVDPEEKHRLVYDGFALPNANAMDWAGLVHQRQGVTKFEACVIDAHMGRSKQVGIWEDKTVASYYWEALNKIGVQVRRHGPMNGFFPGSDDVEARTLALKNWMIPRGDGPFSSTPILQVARGSVPELDREIKRAQTDSARGFKRSTKIVQDLLVCLEYGAAFNPGYYVPEVIRDQQSDEGLKTLSVAEQFREKRRMRARKERAAMAWGA